MYRIFLILMLTLSAWGSAMAQSPGYFSEQIDSSYHYLDKNRIQTGALYDRVFPWANLITYKSTNTIDFKYAKQAWYELYFSKYDRSSIPDVSQLHYRVARNDREQKASVWVI